MKILKWQSLQQLVIYKYNQSIITLLTMMDSDNLNLEAFQIWKITIFNAGEISYCKVLNFASLFFGINHYMVYFSILEILIYYFAPKL